MTERKPNQSLPLVLLVDDDVTMRMLERASLEEAGFRVEEAADGATAISIFWSLQPDVLLLDVVMPGLNGFDVCRQIRQNPKAAFTPILMVTGLGDTESIERAFDSGATDFITKPVNWAMLGHHVRYLLRSSQTAIKLHQSEEQFRFLAEKMVDIVWILDRDFKTAYVSPSIGKVLGFTPEERKLQTLEEMLTPESLQRVREMFQEELRCNDEKSSNLDRSVTIEVQYYRKDGSIVWMEDIARVLRDPSGALVGMHGVSRDISRRKRAEALNAELEAQNRQLQKAESLGRMAGAIAHHFNNQLQAVMGNLELALYGLSRDENPTRILTSALNAAHKAANVSVLMRTYLGLTNVKQEQMKLSEACCQCLPMLRAAIPKELTIETDWPSSDPAIHANANQIQQVVTNLVTNAWEAVTDGQNVIHLTIKTVPGKSIRAAHRFPIGWQPQNTDYVCMEVADAGCGIAEKDIEKIFDPFFSTKFTGRGLGLSVALGIVRAHGGAVTVESEPGKGSIFRVYFPVSSEEVSLLPKKADPALKMKSGCTVLLVDDEEMVRNMAKVMLTRLSFGVYEAKDGAEAVAVFQRHKDEIHCVLCDLTMPRMNGWETLAALRKLSPKIPVVLSSGDNKANVMAGDHIERPQAYLQKPYQLKELDSVIRNVLENKTESIPF
ncbi:MAG: response regulator [Deltaproteobacteria bacterium]|nr:response regulator [Deltaproteobacteria bacterium]